MAREMNWPTLEFSSSMNACAFVLVVSQVVACGRSRLSPEKRVAADLNGICSTVRIWQSAVGHPVCPAKAELERYSYASPNDWKDPWGGIYEYACDGGTIVARSAGPDHVFGTRDDVTSH